MIDLKYPALGNLLIRHEGLQFSPYKDSVGKITIGVGRNLDDRGITRSEAIFLLNNDMDDAIEDARSFKWFGELAFARSLVVVSMIFNLGLTRFRRFRNVIAAIEAKDYERAASEMLQSKWAAQVGLRAEDLAQMMRSGELPSWL